MKRLSRIILFLLVAPRIYSQESSPSQWLVVPNNLTEARGNIGLSGPFTPYNSVITGEYEPSRFQQVYSASQFTSLIPNGGWISGIGFRQWSGGHIGNLPDIQVNLSTSLRSPDGLSSTYGENVGLDDTVVFGRGPLNWLPFTQFVSFTTPFLYDPSGWQPTDGMRTYAGIPLPFPYLQQGVSGRRADRWRFHFIRRNLFADNSGTLFTVGLVSALCPDARARTQFACDPCAGRSRP